MKKGDIVRLRIEDISHEGQGIGKADGFAVFVKNTVLGDVVDAELTKVKKNYAFGKVVEMVEESDLRQEPICQYAGQCGGCAFQKMTYEGQLQLKRKQIVDKLWDTYELTRSKAVEWKSLSVIEIRRLCRYLQVA